MFPYQAQKEKSEHLEVNSGKAPAQCRAHGAAVQFVQKGYGMISHLWKDLQAAHINTRVP